MHLIILADPHLATRSDETQVADTQENFLSALRRIRDHDPDRLVLLGDISLANPSMDANRFAYQRVQLIDVPTDVIAGNHDRSQDLAEAFNLEQHMVGDLLFYRHVVGQLELLFLDTSRGRVEEDQLSWLERELATARGTVLVFMHHPPCKSGVPFMDANYALEDPDNELWRLLSKSTKPIHVFAGHYHTSRTIMEGHCTVHLCPSTYFQIDPSRDEFVIGSTTPAIRHVEILDGQVRTWVEWLQPGNGNGNQE